MKIPPSAQTETCTDFCLAVGEKMVLFQVKGLNWDLPPFGNHARRVGKGDNLETRDSADF